MPRWERAADLGVTALDLGYTVNAFVDGAYAGDYFTGGDKIDLTHRRARSATPPASRT